MIITESILDDLTAKAKSSLRLRMNLDLRDAPSDQCQRMLNAIEPGSDMPIHRHQHTSETVVCLRGCLVEEFYDELDRICTESIELKPGGPNFAVNVPESGGQELLYTPHAHFRHNIFPQKPLSMCMRSVR